MRSAIVQQAWDLFSARLFDQALQVALDAAKSSPDDYEPHYIQSLCHINCGRYQEGTEAALEAIRIAPDQAAGHHARGFAILRKQDDTAYDRDGRVMKVDKKRPHLKDAERYYLEAIRLAPEWAMLWSCYCWLLLLDYRSTEAEQAARKTLELDPNDASTYSVLGQALRDQGRHQEAEAVLQNGLRIDPNHDGLHTHLGWVRFDQGRIDRASDSFREALRLWPNGYIARDGLLAVMKSQYRLYRWFLRIRTVLGDDSLTGLLLEEGSDLLLLMHPVGRLILEKWERYRATICAGLAIPLIGGFLLWMVSHLAGHYSGTLTLVAVRLVSFTLITPTLAVWAGLSVTRWRWLGMVLGLTALVLWPIALLVPAVAEVFIIGLRPWVLFVVTALGGWFWVKRA